MHSLDGLQLTIWWHGRSTKEEEPNCPRVELHRRSQTQCGLRKKPKTRVVNDHTHSKKPYDTMSKNLPDDVLLEILSRLPVKTLIRFRCVCKSWYATITHPTFITTHLNRARSSHSENFIQHLNGHRLYLHSEQIYAKHFELELPTFRTSGDVEVFGSINGVICVFCHDGIYLWNPSIRKFKTLPWSSMPPPRLFDRNNLFVIGFGFHHQTNDYKVVRIRYFGDAASPEVDVYALSTDSWRRIEAVVPCFLKFVDAYAEAYVNGSVHWLAFGSAELGSIDRIMSFDFGDEVFRDMKLPNHRSNRVGGVRLVLGVLKESLFLSVSFPYYDSPRGDFCYIWVMREYGVVESWTKQFTIVSPHNRVWRCLGFTKSNEILLETSIGKLVSYDPESQQLMDIGIQCYGFKIVPFLETLVLLGGGEALLEQENPFDGVSAEGIFLGKRNSKVICNHKQKGLKEEKNEEKREQGCGWSKGGTMSKQEIENTNSKRCDMIKMEYFAIE